MIAIITSLIGLTVATLILLLIRRDQLEAKIGVAWMSVAAGFCLLGFAPSLIDSLARAAGVAHAPSLAFSMALGAVTLKLVYDDVQKSKSQITTKRMTQRLAILETRIRQLEADSPSSLKKNASQDDKT